MSKQVHHKIKVACDLDGVLTDVVSKIIETLNRLGYKIPKDYINTTWDWKDANLPDGALSHAWKVIKDTENFWETLPPIYENIEYMANFYYDHAITDTDIYFVTARPDTKGRSSREQSARWLHDYIGTDNGDVTVLTVKSSDYKIDLLNALEIDYFVDDHTPTIAAVNSRAKECQAYLMTQPWNEREHVYNIKRVSNLSEFFAKIKY